MGYHLAPPLAVLATLLSAERLSTYQRHAPEWGRDPVALYLLGVELSASFQADLALVEVCLRNAMHAKLTAVYGPRWFAERRLLDERSQNAVIKAWADAACRDDDPPGKVVARLPMGFWVHLLEPGGYVGQRPFREHRSYEDLLWRPALHRAFPNNASGRRADVHRLAHILYATRNRIAHHEPIIQGVRRPGVPHTAPNSRRSPQDLHSDARDLLRMISDEVADWFATHSRTPTLLERR
ncbi:CAAX protease [Saccharopolyspora shandongensis]|uniref:CAAX protease n=1 Tax=Saccharopolyspora shandongensis TaxID=418495 RepID=UPI0033DEECA5